MFLYSPCSACVSFLSCNNGGPCAHFCNFWISSIVLAGFILMFKYLHICFPYSAMCMLVDVCLIYFLARPSVPGCEKNRQVNRVALLDSDHETAIGVRCSWRERSHCELGFFRLGTTTWDLGVVFPV